MKSKLVLAIILSVQIQIAWAQARIRYDKKGQATPSAVQPLGEEAFNVQNETVIRWLGNAGFFVGRQIFICLVKLDQPANFCSW